MARRLGKYSRTLLWVFERAQRSGTLPAEIEFTQGDLRDAAAELDFEIRNFPDATYNMRSRAKLPQQLLDAGYRTIEIRGRGAFALTKDDNTVVVPDEMLGDPVTVPQATLPEAIRDILRADEQSILSAVRYGEIIPKFLGVPAHHLQGHLRTTGSLGQQVEADEVYIAEYPEGRRVVPIEAKGAKEKLGRSQIKSVIDAVVAKMPGFPVIPLGLKIGNDGLILIVQFDFDRDDTSGAISDVRIAGAAQYRFEPQLPLWPPAQDVR